MKNTSTFILAFIFILLIQHAQAKELILVFGDYDSKPYTFFTNQTLSGGIIKDIMDQIGVELNINIKYVNIPSKRVSNFLLEGKVHVRLITNPKWFKNHKQFHWSTALFQDKDKIVIREEDSEFIKTIRDLKEKRLGTIRGYKYQILKNNNIIRDDVRTLESNFKRLDRAFIDALIHSDILIDYYIKRNQARSKYMVLEKTASSHSIHAMYSKNNLSLSYKEIAAAFIKLKENGTIQKILDRYK